jgi:ubiquitin-conjugating enzyme (huntingtin interacting protein 2)
MGNPIATVNSSLPEPLAPLVTNTCEQQMPHTIPAANGHTSVIDAMDRLSFVEEGGKRDGNRDKGCRCGRTKCLKQYCACFRQDVRCTSDCVCNDCRNDGKHEHDRMMAVRAIRLNSKDAFKGTDLVIEDQSVTTSKGTVKTVRGCRCKRSNCVKKYCECFGAGLKCGDNCICEDCQNGNELGCVVPPPTTCPTPAPDSYVSITSPRLSLPQSVSLQHQLERKRERVEEKKKEASQVYDRGEVWEEFFDDAPSEKAPVATAQIAAIMRDDRLAPAQNQQAAAQALRDVSAAAAQSQDSHGPSSLRLVLNHNRNEPSSAAILTPIAPVNSSHEEGPKGDMYTRLTHEVAELQIDSDSAGVTAKPVGTDTMMTHWKGTIHGPKDTPYDGGTFVIDIVIPANYPMEPPKMKFDTKVWHPNVSSQTGAICLEFQDTRLANHGSPTGQSKPYRAKPWSPAVTIKMVLISVRALLAAPEPDNPQDDVVANEYKSDHEKWKRTAKLWTKQYASEADAACVAPSSVLPPSQTARNARRTVGLPQNEGGASRKAGRSSMLVNQVSVGSGEVVCRHQSLTAAAEAADVAPSTMSNKIKLGQELGGYYWRCVDTQGDCSGRGARGGDVGSRSGVAACGDTNSEDAQEERGWVSQRARGKRGREGGADGEGTVSAPPQMAEGFKTYLEENMKSDKCPNCCKDFTKFPEQQKSGLAKRHLQKCCVDFFSAG